MNTIRILLADQYKVSKEILNGIQLTTPQIELVANAVDGHEALRLVQLKRPDIVIFAEKLEQLDGITAAEHLCLLQPDIGVLMIIENENETVQARIRKIGVQGWVSRRDLRTELPAAVHKLVSLLRHSA